MCLIAPQQNAKCEAIRFGALVFWVHGAIFSLNHKQVNLIYNGLYREVGKMNSRCGMCNLDVASVCGRRAGEVKRRRRDGGNGAGVQRRRRPADGSQPLMRPLELPLVTSARFAKRNGRG
jgi:hypothetical protein